MRKPVSSVLVITAAAALALGLSATTSFATTAKTWTVTPGGSITGKSTSPTLTDTNTGTKLTCKTASAAGQAKSGKGLPGAKLATVTALSFATCTGPAGLTFTVKTSAFPWFLNATGYNASTGVAKGKITGGHATLSGPGCSATVDGTSATADNGSIAGTYTNSTHKLKAVPAGSNLHVYNVSGCLGLINNGDAAVLAGSFAITPAQKITSP